MYVPAMFAVEDRRELLGYAEAHPFATVTSCLANELAVGHLPLLVDGERGLLRGHLARENPQFQHFEHRALVVAVFHGPHGYVSPSVYGAPGVPTWNYVAVQVRGRARLVDEAELVRILDRTVERFDTSGWRMAANEATVRPKLAAIAGFEVTIEAIEGKWKLSQNRPPEDQARVIEWLERGDDTSRATAALMRSRRDTSSRRDP
jgi:transcriptional regulator